MSNKRPLSPESTNGLSNENNIRSLKRFKLHSILQELRNEEANLALLKKLRVCQQLASKTNITSTTTTTTITNGFHTAATRVPANKPATTLPLPINASLLSSSSSRSSLQPSLLSAVRKPASSLNPPLPTKIPAPLPTKNSLSSSSSSSSSSLAAAHSFEERKTQAKKALRNQLERDLLNIPSPKPLLQDILFIPNPTSLEFQPYIGFEDVVQCLHELQTDRQRLPQRFTDRAQVEEPNICDHCGTDFTIRWWKHVNNNQQTDILCDRCKKQATRRTLKSEHSALLKNVFVSAMDQEKEIEKTFQTLIKQQQKNAPRPSSSSSTGISKPTTNNRPVISPISTPIPSTTPIPPYNHHHQQQHSKSKTKTSIPQAQSFATKLSQQPAPPISAARKSNPMVQSQINSTNNIRSLSHSKTPTPAHQQQQQYRSVPALPQQMKINNQMVKLPKTAVRQQPVGSSRPMYPPTSGLVSSAVIHSALPSSANIRPTATKRRTLPAVNIK